MRPDSTLTASPSLSPVTAPRHARACPRCGGRLVQLEDPTCLPCGWVDYSVEGLTCGICRADLPATRQRFCSDACSSAAKTRRHQGRARQGLCLRCAAPTNGRSYCPRHVDEVARGPRGPTAKPRHQQIVNLRRIRRKRPSAPRNPAFGRVTGENDLTESPKRTAELTLGGELRAADGDVLAAPLSEGVPCRW